MTEIFPYGGVNLKAFDKKLSKIWVYLPSSPLIFLRKGSNSSSISTIY